MDEAREEAVWEPTSWILAQLHLCKTEEAQKGGFEPLRWHMPTQRAKHLVALARKRKETTALTEAERQDKIKAARIAEWRAFRSLIRK